MIHAVIMAGGKGTRFWPLSRAVKAKQFLSLLGEKTLIEQTIERLFNYIKYDQIWIVTNESQKEFFKEVKINPSQILYEPVGRNTAPCITWAALEIAKVDPDAIMVVLPADHFIEQQAKFVDCIKRAVQWIDTHDSLVTIGITPTFPHTGYGYIEVGSQEDDISKVNSFKEKPDMQTAKEYLSSGNYFWNSGIFIWRASTMLRLVQENIPEIYDKLDQMTQIQEEAGKYQENVRKVYKDLKSISIDYGVMEKAADMTYLIKSDFDWNDIGNWSALEKYWEKDSNNNSYRGKVLTINSHDNIIFSQKRFISLVDVSDLIVIDADDAIMILPKTSDQKIRDLYDHLPDDYK